MCVLKGMKIMRLGCAETAGSMGAFAPNRNKSNTPFGKIGEDIKQYRKMKALEEIETIKNKPASERTLDEKIKLANHYGNLVYDKVTSIDPKIYTIA